MRAIRFLSRLLPLALTTLFAGAPARPASSPPLFSRTNLVAWCIVPFDTAKRTPLQRAEMLQRLGIHKLAYDWRDEHVATFEDEILECKKHGIEYFAFWGSHPAIFPLLAKYQVAPQFWSTVPSPAAGSSTAAPRTRRPRTRPSLV